VQPIQAQTIPINQKTSQITFATQGWQVSCAQTSAEVEESCEASQIVSLKQNGQAILAAFLTPARQDEKRVVLLRLRLPHGLSIPAGINLSIDDTKPSADIVLQTSTQAGIFARTVVTPSLRKDLAVGRLLEVTFQTLDGARITVPVQLKGFNFAYQKTIGT
jgi:invasion protein IalB